MVFLFRDKSIANIFFLAVLSIALHFHFLVDMSLVVPDSNDGIISMLLSRYFRHVPQTVLFVTYHALVLIQAIRLNFVLNDQRMYATYSYATAMAYILLSATLPQWCTITAALVSNFLLIWIFTKLSKLYNNPAPKTLLFNTGLIVGGSILCYHPTAILIPVVLFALTVVRPFRLTEWLILLMGTLLPFYFVFSWLFLSDAWGQYRSFLPLPHPGLPMQQWDMHLIISLSYLLLVLMAGLYQWQRTMNRMGIQVRKTWGIMFLMLPIVLAVPFIFRNAGVESAVMSLVPLAAFAGAAFSGPRRLALPNLLFWLAIGVVCYNNWHLIKN